MDTELYGHCEECGVPFALRKDGKVREHSGPGVRRCLGGSGWPLSLERATEQCSTHPCSKPATHRGLHDIPAGVKP